MIAIASTLSDTRGRGTTNARGRGGREAIAAVAVGAGSYGDGEPHTYVDTNGVSWVIVDNDCGWGDGFSCTSTDTENRYWATQRIRRYSFDPVPSLRAPDLDAVKVLVDKFAAGRSPDVAPPSSSSNSDDDDGEGEDAPLDPGAKDAPPPKPLARKPPPLPAYSATAASDASLASIQRALIGLGYGVGATGADGKSGPSTDAAIKRFKAAHGVAPADAAVTPVFRSALAAAVRARNAASAEGGSSVGWVVGGVILAAVAGVVVKRWVG